MLEENPVHSSFTGYKQRILICYEAEEAAVRGIAMAENLFNIISGYVIYPKAASH